MKAKAGPRVAKMPKQVNLGKDKTLKAVPKATKTTHSKGAKTKAPIKKDLKKLAKSKGKK